MSIEIQLYHNYEAIPLSESDSDMRIIFRSSRGRRSGGEVVIAQIKYKNRGYEYEYFIHNNGFDCNYKREWKTLKGAVRFFEKRYGKIILPAAQ